MQFLHACYDSPPSFFISDLIRLVYLLDLEDLDKRSRRVSALEPSRCQVVLSAYLKKGINKGSDTSSTEEEMKRTAEPCFWFTPIHNDEDYATESGLKNMLAKGAYGLGDRSGGRKLMRPGDWMCFYQTGNGIVAHAKINSEAKHKPDPRVVFSILYPWTIELTNCYTYFENPVKFDEETAIKLDYFGGKSYHIYSWFLASTHRISKHDFEILIRTPSE